MDAFTPAQTTELVSRMGAKKARLPLTHLFINGFLGGALISFGCALSLSTNSSPWFLLNAPGLLRTIAAMVFPVGLIMVVLTGADLYTSYCMFSVVALLHRRITILDALKNLVVSFLSNLAGALFFMAVLTGYGGTFEVAPYKTEALAFAKTKVVTPEWHQIFLKGILCNWLVCMAVYLSISSREIFSKMLAIWFPVMCFVGLGTDHVIANMYFIPLAIFLGSPDITVGLYIWKSMIPSGLGNFVGGGLFMGVLYWYLHLAGGADVYIHFDNMPLNTPYERGGVLRGEGVVVNGTSGGSVNENDEYKNTIPDAGNGGLSGIGRDYHKSHFKRDVVHNEDAGVV